MAEGDNGKNGGENDAIKKLTSEMESMKKMLDDAKKANVSLSDELTENKSLLTEPKYLKFLEGEQRKSVSGEGSPTNEDDTDFNSMSATQIVAYMEKKTQSNLDKQVKLMGGMLEKMQDRLLLIAADSDLKALKSVDSDFRSGMQDSKFSEKFYSIADENPTWMSEQIWDKMRKDKSWDDKVVSDEKVRKEDEERENLQGIVDSEKGGVPASITEDKSLEGKDAAEKAVELVLGTKGLGEE